MKQSHFLFLQGMQSSFFRRVGELLACKNCRVSRINLCAGDWLFWHGRHCENYSGTPAAWSDYIGSFLEEKGVTDLVLVGEQRRYHKEAVQAAKARGIKVIVTDFGYLRPDWIALEEQGMNGDSLLPKDFTQIAAMGHDLPAASLEPVSADSEARMIFNDVVYYCANLLGWSFFPHYVRSDMRPNPFKGYCYSVMKWLRLGYDYRRTRDFVAAAEAGSYDYFLFAMQLEHDFQIVAYSRYVDMIEPLREVMQSFSAYGPEDCRLIIKNHPCDLGIRGWRKIIAGMASEYNLEGRVHFVDGGTAIDRLAGRACGLVTVNSTAGLRALQLGCPVKTLDQAIYSMKGLTWQESLDTFWSQVQPPDRQRVALFIKVIATKLHVRGVFFKEPGLTCGVNAFAEKLVRQDVGLRSGLRV